MRTDTGWQKRINHKTLARCELPGLSRLASESQCDFHACLVLVWPCDFRGLVLNRQMQHCQSHQAFRSQSIIYHTERIIFPHAFSQCYYREGHSLPHLVLSNVRRQSEGDGIKLVCMIPATRRKSLGSPLLTPECSRSAISLSSSVSAISILLFMVSSLVFIL